MAEEVREARAPLTTQVLETLAELCLVALAVLYVIDQGAGNAEPHSLMPAMLGLLVVLLALLVGKRSQFLLTPAGGLVVGVALGLMLSLARSHAAKSIITEGESPEFYEISWAGIVVLAAAIFFLLGAACDRFRKVRETPYVPAIVIGTLGAVALDLILYVAIRPHVQALERPPLVGFITYAPEYAMLLIIGASVATEWRKRRLAIYCVLALAVRLAIEAMKTGAGNG